MLRIAVGVLILSACSTAAASFSNCDEFRARLAAAEAQLRIPVPRVVLKAVESLPGLGVEFEVGNAPPPFEPHCILLELPVVVDQINERDRLICHPVRHHKGERDAVRRVAHLSVVANAIPQTRPTGDQAIQHDRLIGPARDVEHVEGHVCQRWVDLQYVVEGVVQEPIKIHSEAPCPGRPEVRVRRVVTSIRLLRRGFFMLWFGQLTRSKGSARAQVSP